MRGQQYFYENAADGERISSVPLGAAELARCTPVYESVPGWKRSTVGIRSYDALPEGARGYIERMHELLEVPIDIISTGPERDDTIVLKHPFE